MLLGILLGNSTVRYGILDCTQVLVPGALAWGELETRAGELARLAVEFHAAEAVVGSVRDDLLPLLERSLPPHLLPATIARRDFPLPIENRYERPEDAGTDRLLACIAARRRSDDAGAVVVDFGTAVSLSVVSPEGAFLGGPIAAGAASIARGLGLCTPRLGTASHAAARGRSPDEFVPRTTVSAARAGVHWQVVGGVRALLRGILESVPFRPRIIATGGEAEIFCERIPEIDEVVTYLVLEGLAIACASRPGRHGDQG